MPFGLGIGEVALIFAILLLVFGAKRLPEIGGALGKGIRDFKRSINGLDDTQSLPPSERPPVDRPVADRPVTDRPAVERPEAAEGESRPLS
jgi:sec-independent protein translocase protein TatA